jgi:phospholipid/cholesterol/gamma-HCH transport system permease protein
VNVVRALGRGGEGMLREVARSVLLGLTSVGAMTRTEHAWRTTARLAVRLTLTSAMPVFVVVFVVGALLSLQALLLLRMFGVEEPLAPLAAAAVVREMAPGFSAVLCAMQAGAGVAAAVASMSLRDELTALRSMGVDPRGVVAGPHIVALTVAAPLLNALGIGAGLAGATVMAVLKMGVPRAMFVDGLLSGVDMRDVWLSEAKAVVFGIVIGVVCVRAGMRPAHTAKDIGGAATTAVVWSVILILVMNYAINTAVLGLRGGA